MQQNLLLQYPADTINKNPAPVIPIWPDSKKKTKQQKGTPVIPGEKLPFFYNTPVFKSKKHDFL